MANFVVDRRLTTKEIHDCLTLEWVPPATYAFPEYIEGKQKRRFLHKYLTQFPWLAYSKKYEGAYCKFCVVFAFSGGGVGQQVNILQQINLTIKFVVPSFIQLTKYVLL